MALRTRRKRQISTTWKIIIGMVVLLPLLGHATWHAYKDLLGD